LVLTEIIFPSCSNPGLHFVGRRLLALIMVAHVKAGQDFRKLVSLITGSVLAHLPTDQVLDAVVLPTPLTPFKLQLVEHYIIGNLYSLVDSTESFKEEFQQQEMNWDKIEHVYLAAKPRSAGKEPSEVLLLYPKMVAELIITYSWCAHRFHLGNTVSVSFYSSCEAFAERWSSVEEDRPLVEFDFVKEVILPSA
jgi:hypothetical protein